MDRFAAVKLAADHLGLDAQVDSPLIMRAADAPALLEMESGLFGAGEPDADGWAAHSERAGAWLVSAALSLMAGYEMTAAHYKDAGRKKPKGLPALGRAIKALADQIEPMAEAEIGAEASDLAALRETPLPENQVLAANEAAARSMGQTNMTPAEIDAARAEVEGEAEAEEPSRPAKGRKR